MRAAVPAPVCEAGEERRGVSNPRPVLLRRQRLKLARGAPLRDAYSCELRGRCSV